MMKTTLCFRVLFADGDLRWLPLTKDLDATVAIGTFFLAHPPLRQYSFQSPQAVAEFLKAKKREPITAVKKGDVLYVDLRSYGSYWYDEVLEVLEDRFDKIYVVEYQVTEVFATRINATCDVLQEIWDAPRGPSSLGSYWYFAWTHKDFNAERMALVTKEMLLRYPRLIPWDSAVQRRVLLHHFPDLHDVDQILEAVNPTQV